MAITIDWGTQIINIPKSYTTLIQASPTEIRELPLNQFRLDLKVLEADLEGIPHLVTHSHNTEVLLGGITYARIIEIINGYTITFEDGQYAVNLTGANSNVGDVVNVNQVSVRSANAAGLISNQAIEYSSFNGAVTLDAINGVVGTIFPKGTPQLPVNNVPDAITIAELRGFTTINVVGDYTFDTGDDLSGYQVYGQSSQESTLTFLSGSTVNRINLFDATITGIFDGKANFTDCVLTQAQFIEGTIIRCLIEGDITLDGIGNTQLINCFDGLTSSGATPTINFGGTGSSLGIRNYSGDIRFINKTGPQGVEVNIATGGKIIVDDSVTNGVIRITGIADVEDNTISGATVDVSRVIFPDQLQLSSFNGQVHLDVANGFSGTKYPIGTSQTPSNNIDDTLQILANRGINQITLGGPLYLTDTDISGLSIVGENNLDAVVVLLSGNTTTKTSFKDMILVGEVNGHIFVNSCGLQTLSNVGSNIFPSVFRDCIIRADNGATPAITLSSGSTQNLHFIECVSGVPGQGTATLDFNSSLTPVAFRKYGGGITVKNITGNQDSTFEFDEGQIVLDSSCTSGNVKLGGIYKLTNNSSLTVEERNQSITDSISISGGTFTGDTQAIAAAVWDKLTADHETANTFGKMINDILEATGQSQHTLNVHSELLKNKPNNP